MRRAGPRGLALAAAWVLAAGACSPARPSPPPAQTPSASPAPALPSGSGSVLPSSSTPGTIPVDPGLLAILPAAVDGADLQPIPEAAGTVDPAVADRLVAIAYAIAVKPATGDQVVALVARVRPDRFDAETFRDWRDSFDEGVCARAGGVVGRAEAEIGGRTTYIGTCTEGVITYHVLLPDRDVVVSAQALGTARLGERLVEGLRP